MPGTRYTARVGESFTVEARITINGSLADPVTIRTGLFSPGMVALETVTPTRISAGVYRATFSAVPVGGRYHDYWYYRTVAGTEEAVRALHVDVADAVLVVNETVTAAEPDIGEENVCRITHRFYNASGQAIAGVEVTFQANRLIGQVREDYSIRDEVTALSDATGAVELVLVRGLQGLLTVHGFEGMCQQVTIPDTGAADLFDIYASTENPLSVIRRSRDMNLLVPR